MEEAVPFTELVDRSFARMEDMVGRHSLRRISGMERRLEALERDLTVFLDEGTFSQGKGDCTAGDRQPRVFY